MKTTIQLLAVISMTLTALFARADEARLMRFPATNGIDVAFSYAGDIYTVPITGGTARRLTSHNGYEAFARYSPDGQWIAFTGQYDGNTEVYLMPAQGGQPKRLTYTANNPRDDWGDRMGPNNITLTWTPDGKSVIYRNRISDSFTGQLWSVPVNGDMPTQLPLPEGGFCSYSPDGSQLAYNRVMREFRTWKYYRGGMADDIWIYNPDKKTVDNVSNNVAQDIFPMWVGNEIYYTSDRDKTMNLFVYNTATGQTRKVTHFSDYDVRFPSTNGNIIVFEKGGYLFRFDPATGYTTQIHVTVNDEGTWARTTIRQVEDFLTMAGLSPDGKRIAVTARGEVFDVPAKTGVTRNITHTAGAHERQAKWSPDGQHIAYISDITGETELYLQPADGGKPIQLTRDNDTYIRDFNFSPDSRKIVYTDRENRIVLVDIAARTKTTLLQDSIGEFPTPTFSPDGRWLTYYQATRNENNVVYLYDIAARKAYPVTDNWYDSNSPAFSSDGRYLIFASGRDFNPTYSSIEWNFAYNNLEGIYLALLDPETPSPFLPTDDKVATGKPDEESAKTDNKPKKQAETKPAARIVPEGIENRIVKLPLSGGNYGAFVCDGENLWYSNAGGTHIYDLKKQADQLIATGARMTASADLKKAMFRKGRQLYVTDLPKAKVELTTPVNLTEMTANVDYSQEWQQIFNEAWRAYRDGFYLKTMHGVDWNAIRDKYAPLVPHVRNRLDLTYVIGGMIGELACGHAYVNGGDHIQPDRQSIGMLGAELIRDNNAFKIKHILKGAPERSELRSPLTEPGMNIREGDYIIAVDGQTTDNVANIYTLLQGKAGVLTELTIASSPTGANARKVVVKPIRDEYPLHHYQWVRNNIDYVNKKTDGRVGYIYIPDMGPEGLREFARYFFPQIDKEALIIDDRGNGGGNISPMIIERLLRKPYRMTMYRGSNHNGTIPAQTVYGPKVLLLNKYSASDGDLFPWSFKENRIGTVIGTRSWGGIVGISGSLPYIDGTDIRVPFFTNYDTRGNWIVENHGVDPDILIDNNPIDEYNGIDNQLDKAIEVILDQLRNRIPLPSTPAPRTLRDLGVE